MWYYQVWVANPSYKRTDPLTYHYNRKLAVGTCVKVSLQRTVSYGVIVAAVKKPAFRTVAIHEAFDSIILPAELLSLASFMVGYYHATIGEVTAQILPNSLSFKLQNSDYVLSEKSSSQLPPLTASQSKALQEISGPGTYVLHGDTGSGKTRVYLELAKKSLKNGKSCLILTPEIGLTPQLTAVFSASLPNDTVFTTHSKLNPKERSSLWQQIFYRKQPAVLIGPRSALFYPLSSLGLIVVDEAHEVSYKQEKSPRYHALPLAAKLASLHHASLVIGSATPPLTDYYIASAKGRRIVQMSGKAISSAAPKPNLQVVDLKNTRNFTKSAHISDQLLAAIENSLYKKQQSLLFINRRGTARITLCNACGWQAMCERCNLPLTYHGDTHALRCHTCGKNVPALSACPECNNTDILLKSIGTKAIVDEITTLFPKAKTIRFDNDNIKSERLEEKYQAVANGDFDIIVGTQTIAKGLDLPKLSVVGVLIADSGLYFPDYTAGERTYQLLHQVMGRVGRGHGESDVIVQTYNPENPLIQAALHNNWQTFYEEELAERKKYLFPPFCFTLKVWCRRASSQAARRAGLQAAKKLTDAIPAVIIEGPTPSFHEKHGDKYQWQLIIKAKNRTDLLRVIDHLPSGWSYDIDPLSLL
jgi:primosomal protein N' (replication factor Y)